MNDKFFEKIGCDIGFNLPICLLCNDNEKEFHSLISAAPEMLEALIKNGIMLSALRNKITNGSLINEIDDELCCV